MMLKNTAATHPQIVCSVLYSFIADYRILPYYYCFSALLPSWIINGVGAASPNFLFGNPEKAFQLTILIQNAGFLMLEPSKTPSEVVPLDVFQKFVDPICHSLNYGNLWFRNRSKSEDSLYTCRELCCQIKAVYKVFS